MKKAFSRVMGALIIAIAAAAVTMAVSSGTANAKPEFAAQTGKACGFCHVAPGGGGKLKPAGEKFKANGFKL